MDQAEKLRNVIKLKNKKAAWENPALQLIWQSSFRK